MIRVSGMAILSVFYEAELDITEEAFVALSKAQQDELIGGYVDWQYACRSADIDDIEVHDVEEVTA